MSDPIRYIPTWPFPDYKFVPGENPHPKKSGGHMEGLKDPETPPVDLHNPQGSQFLRYALDLLNFGYYWESHVYFEALWNAHKREGIVADFFKALIKVGAAGVKVKVGQWKLAVEHYDRALELISGIQNQLGHQFLGFDLNLLKTVIAEAKASPSYRLEVHPDWK